MRHGNELVGCGSNQKKKRSKEDPGRKRMLPSFTKRQWENSVGLERKCLQEQPVLLVELGKKMVREPVCKMKSFPKGPRINLSAW